MQFTQECRHSENLTNFKITTRFIRTLVFVI